MQDLIDRLSRATGPDGRLNAEIECAVKFPQHRPARKGDHADVHGVDPESEHIGMIYVPTGFLMAHNYTGNFRDALRLVEPGWSWAAGDCNEDDVPWACLTNAEGVDVAAEAATPELAMVIAALKARSQS